MAHMGGACPLYSWSTNPVHFKLNISENEIFSIGTFENTAEFEFLRGQFCLILVPFDILEKCNNLSILAISKLPIKNCSFFACLYLKVYEIH